MAPIARAVNGSNIDLEAQVSHSTTESSLQSEDENSQSSDESTLIPSTNASNASTETLPTSLAPSIIIPAPKPKDVPSPTTRSSIVSLSLPPGGKTRLSFTKCHPYYTISLYTLAILLVIGWMSGAIVLIVIGCKGGNGGGLKIGFGVGMLCVGFVPTTGLYGSVSVRWEERGVRRTEARLVRAREARVRGEW